MNKSEETFEFWNGNVINVAEKERSVFWGLVKKGTVLVWPGRGRIRQSLRSR